MLYFCKGYLYDPAMGFESLSHTPEFELPTNAPNAPADLISLLEECHEGLSKAIVSKMIRRGKYEQIATVLCQENATKKTTPVASADDIADYCMMCMQYDIEKVDDAGTYRVMLIGPPGKGRFERSKHIDLGEGDGMARSKQMMSEGELIEQQSQYIGELHSQSIAVLETLHGMVKPLLQENKEQMKIISESARRLAEVERDRMRHDLEMRIHSDGQKLEESKEEMKNQRWTETLDVIKDSGMVEGFMKAIIKKMRGGGRDEEDDDDDDDDDEDEDRKAKKEKKKKEKKKPRPTAPKTSGAESDPKAKKKKKKGESSRVDKAKKKRGDKSKKKKKKRAAISEETQKAIEDGDEMTVEQVEEVFQASGMNKARDNPIALMVEILKMSIDENEQWPIIEETLTADQLKLFKRILKTEDDKKIEKRLRRLYQMKGARRLLKLENHFEEDQQGYLEKLIEIAMSD